MSFSFVSLDHNMPYNVSYTNEIYFFLSLTRKAIHPTTPKLMTKKAFASTPFLLLMCVLLQRMSFFYLFRMPLKPIPSMSHHTKLNSWLFSTIL
jgi:hypothetical protein